MFSYTPASRPRPLVFLQKVHLSDTEDKMFVLSVGRNDIIVKLSHYYQITAVQLTSWIILANIKIVFTTLLTTLTQIWTSLEKTDHLRVSPQVYCCCFWKAWCKAKISGLVVGTNFDWWQQECESYCCFYVGHYWINNHSRCETKHLTPSSEQTEEMHSLEKKIISHR